MRKDTIPKFVKLIREGNQLPEKLTRADTLEDFDIYANHHGFDCMNPVKNVVMQFIVGELLKRGYRHPYIYRMTIGEIERILGKPLLTAGEVRE